MTPKNLKYCIERVSRQEPMHCQACPIAGFARISDLKTGLPGLKGQPLVVLLSDSVCAFSSSSANSTFVKFGILLISAFALKSLPLLLSRFFLHWL